MPEQSPYPNESKEDYKERIKKLKARTSKMRLAIVKKKEKGYWDIECDTCGFSSDKESQMDKMDDHQQHRKDSPDHEYKST